MRGEDSKQSSMLCLISAADRVPKDHPLRQVKVLADQALAGLSKEFDAMYSRVGRPSIPPERLLKSMLLAALYSLRSERQLCEQLEYNLLFRWFLDMDMVSPAFDATTFTKNRDRLLEHDVGRKFFALVVGQAKDAGLISSEHFSVDGTLIEAWASIKSFRPKDEKDEPPGGDDGTTGSKSNRWVNFRGEKRRNDTHESKTDPEAKLMRKGWGKEAKLSFAATALMENRNGLLVDLRDRVLEVDLGLRGGQRGASPLRSEFTSKAERHRVLGHDGVLAVAVAGVFGLLLGVVVIVVVQVDGLLVRQAAHARPLVDLARRLVHGETEGATVGVRQQVAVAQVVDILGGGRLVHE